MDKDSLLPITSDYPGVTIETVEESVPSERVYEERLTLEAPLYHFLWRGENHFICKASTFGGKRARAGFVVIKNQR